MATHKPPRCGVTVGRETYLKAENTACRAVLSAPLSAHGGHRRRVRADRLVAGGTPQGLCRGKLADAAQLTHCRENSHGILLGCSGRQDKWQKFRDIFVVRTARRVRFVKFRLTGPLELRAPPERRRRGAGAVASSSFPGPRRWRQATSGAWTVVDVAPPDGSVLAVEAETGSVRDEGFVGVRDDVQMTTLGVVCLPQVHARTAARYVAVAADAAGLEELWLWEDGFWGGAVPACAAMLAWTTRLRVGIGVLPVPLRSVATTAMDAAMLHRLFPDRVTIGVGHGIQSWMQQNGVAAQSPMTLLTEYLTSLRELLGRQSGDGGRPLRAPRGRGARVAADRGAGAILVGAIGPRTLKLSGEAADGTVLVAASARTKSATHAHSSRKGRRPPDAVTPPCRRAPGGRRARRLTGGGGRPRSG